MSKLKSMYKRHRFPPEIIQYAVWLYYRFNLSHRDIVKYFDHIFIPRFLPIPDPYEQIYYQYATSDLEMKQGIPVSPLQAPLGRVLEVLQNLHPLRLLKLQKATARYRVRG